MKLLLLFILGLLSTTLSFELEESGDPDAVFGGKTPSLQTININESNEGKRVKVVKITGIVGEIGFTVSADSRIIELLNATIDDGLDSSSKYLSANRLDCESLSVIKTFPADIFENNDMINKQVVSLSIVNTDDESPTLTVTSCDMNESEPTSECEFIISDPDGFLDKIDFSDVIVGTKGENDIFKLEYRDVPPESETDTTVYLRLKSNQTLDYETKMFYNFYLTIKDAAGHPTLPSDIPVIVLVNDLPDMPPIWDSIRNVYNIPANTEQNIQISAIDGDIGINNPINYKILQTSLPDAVTIDEETGLITVAPIDPAAGTNEVILFVEAFEKPDPSSAIQATIRLLVLDNGKGAKPM